VTAGHRNAVTLRGYCKTCQFWHANQGQCRRYAPDATKHKHRFPQTAMYCWCGDYKRKHTGYIDGVPSREFWEKHNNGKKP